MPLDSLCNDTLSNILLKTNSVDQWLLRFVCKRFCFLISPLNYDPKRERILDIVLSKALTTGGLSTVRFLWGKPSGIWFNASKIAIKHKHTDIIKFLLDNKCEHSPMDVFLESLKSNNLELSKLLYKFNYIYTSAIIRAIIESNSIEILEWMILKRPNLIKQFEYPLFIIEIAIIQKISIEFMKKLLSCIRRLTDHEIDCMMSFCIERNSSHIIQILREVPEKDKKLIQCLIMTGIFDSDSPKELLEKAYPSHLDIMLEVPIHLTNDFHGFLRSKGHVFNLDMHYCIEYALIYKNTDKVKILMELEPDVNIWLKYLSSNISRYKVKIDILKLIVDFIGDHKIHFEINNYENREAFDILSNIGGQCGRNTFINSVLYGDDDNQLYIEVWNKLNEIEKNYIIKYHQNRIIYKSDIYLFEFLESQGIILENEHRIFWNANYFTKDLVNVCLQKYNISYKKLLHYAISFGHLDIIEMLVPLCTYRELLNFNCSDRSYVKQYIKQTIIKKTHPLFKLFVSIII